MFENENEYVVPAFKVTTDSLGTVLNHIRQPLLDEDFVAGIQTLLPSQTSEACELLFKRTIEDLKEKLGYFGIEWLNEIAGTGNLQGTELSRYGADEILDISLRTGLLSRADWKRLKNCGRIISNLKEHPSETLLLENGYYLFSVLVGSVLSRECKGWLKVRELGQLNDPESKYSLSPAFYEAYEKAAAGVQFDIINGLIATIKNGNSPHDLKENRWETLRSIQTLTKTETKILTAQLLEKNINTIDMLTAQLGDVTQATPYLVSKSSVQDLYLQFSQELKASIGNPEREMEMIRKFETMGGLKYCPDEYYGDILKRLFLIYSNESVYGTGMSHDVSYYRQEVVQAIDAILEGEGQKIVPYLKKIRGASNASAQEFNTSLFHGESSVWTKLRKWIDGLASKKQ